MKVPHHLATSVSSSIRRAGSLLLPVSGVLAAAGVWIASQVPEYAVLDDYRMVSAVKRMRPLHIEGHAGTELGTGRVVPALLFDIVWTSVSSVADLWYVRVIGLSVVALTIAWFLLWIRSVLQISGFAAHFALAVSGYLVLLLPTVSATTTWAQKATQLLAFPLAIGAGIFATSKSLNKKSWMLITLLIFLSAFTYQHITMVAVFPTALWAGLEHEHSRESQRLRRVAVVSTLAGCSLLVNFLFVRVYSSDVLKRISGRTWQNRLDELFDFSAKSIHLYVEKHPSLVIVSLALYVLVVGTSIWTAGNSSAIRILTSVLFSIGCLLAVTLVSDGDSSYRAVFPIQIVTWIGASVLVVHASNTSPRVRLTKYLPVMVLCLSAIWLTNDAHRTLHTRIALANHNDWRDLKCTLRRVAVEKPQAEVILRLAPITLSGEGAAFSEIGLLARHIGWILHDQVDLAVSTTDELNSLNEINFGILDFEDVVVDGTTSVSVIDLRQPCSKRLSGY